MKLSKDIQRKFDLIDSLARLNKPSLHDLYEATSIPESTIKRQLGALRDEFLYEDLVHSGINRRAGYDRLLCADGLGDY